MHTSIAVVDDRVVGSGSTTQDALMDAIETGDVTLQQVLDGDVAIYQLLGTARFEVEAG